MKNVLISIMLGLLITSCASSKYQGLDQQFANSSDRTISAKYNNKACMDAEKKKEKLVRQIAIATQEY